MRVAFAGTPPFAARALEALAAAGHEIVLVLTRPDSPAGRGLNVAASAVGELAARRGFALSKPRTLRDPASHAPIVQAAPDVMVVAAYGLILPREVLGLPRLGCINIHASLLPRWRGAAPIQRALLAGDARTGVAIMRMDEGLDTGPVLLEKRTPIGPDDTGGSLHDRLARLGAEVLAEGLRRALAGEALVATPQPGEGVTYAHKLDKAEARLDFARPAVELERAVRAFDPWPVAEGAIAGEPVRIWAARAVERSHEAPPGTVLAASRGGIELACGEGALRVTELQRPGGKRIGVADYLNARPELRGASK